MWQRATLPTSALKRRFCSNPSTPLQQPSAPGSPELEARLQNLESFSDLNWVNQALEEIRQRQSSPDNHDDRKEAYIASLNTLSYTITCETKRCRILLKEALKACDQEKPECCRALCLEIVRNPYAEEVPVKVYAHNILSTFASPGQAEVYLDVATRLLMNYDKLDGAGEFQALLETVELLRKGAKKRETRARRLTRLDEECGEDEACSGIKWRDKKRPRTEVGGDGHTSSNRQNFRISSSAGDQKGTMAGSDENRGKYGMRLTKAGLDKPNTDDSVLMTPRTEKIIRWAFENGRARTS